jgi:hypothetical protein
VRAEVLLEPELEFGGGGRHIDPRFGIRNYGPADLSGPADALGPRAVRVGLIGPADQLDGVRAWLERCRDPIAAKDERYPTLFPDFPGCDIDRGLHTTLVLSDRASAAVSNRALRQITAASDHAAAINAAVEAYVDEVRVLAEQNRVDVILLARPEELLDTRPRRAVQRVVQHATRARRSTSRRTVREDTAQPEADYGAANRPFANFHDILKARLINLGLPIQIIRRSTWDEATRPPSGTSRQDEATRAWNLHVAMYHKAGGVPWRLIRDPRDLTACWVGISFYRNDIDDTLETAVAQVFNERGDGVVVRGGTAPRRGDDRQPHLTEQAAHDLLLQALDAYRQVHRTLPARVVVHKTSSYLDDEQAGFRAAADERTIDELDLTWITISENVRLFRPGNAPPLRGTHLDLGQGQSVLYTKGSVDFYRTYPGLFVPQPIGLRHQQPTRSPTELASEVLALTKMNWNQTRLDGKLPVTLRTAEQVKRILRFCDPDQPVATRYANYM